MPLEYPGEGANEGLMFQFTDYKLSRKSFFRIETTSYIMSKQIILPQ